MRNLPRSWTSGGKYPDLVFVVVCCRLPNLLSGKSEKSAIVSDNFAGGEIVDFAVERLLDRINDPSLEPKNEVLLNQLITRGVAF